MQWWQVDKINPTKLYDDNRSVCGFHLMALLFDQGRAELVSEVMHDLLKLYAQGKIHPTIDSTWAFEEVRLCPGDCVRVYVLSYLIYIKE